jgi:cytochrome bd ubiquinol oxidase subunit I
MNLSDPAFWSRLQFGFTRLVDGLFYTRDGYSRVVSNGDTIFTLIGFIGLYFVLGLLFLYLVGREIAHGPDENLREKELVTGRQTEEAFI